MYYGCLYEVNFYFGYQKWERKKFTFLMRAKGVEAASHAGIGVSPGCARLSPGIS